MIDTHAHIYLEDFQSDIEEVISESKALGVHKMFMPNIDTATIEPMIALETRYPLTCYAMIGLHPCYVRSDYKKQLRTVEDWLNRRSFLAIGEIGTDLHWDKSTWKLQKEAFVYQCGLALDYQMPIVIHSRESIEETIELVASYKGALRGVFHCFTGSAEQAQRITDLGFYVGIGGVATFKNGGLARIIHTIDRHRIVLETDAPYLAPTPNRGKRNEPKFLPLIAKKVADYLDLTIEEVDRLTTKNAEGLFLKNAHLDA